MRRFVNIDFVKDRSHPIICAQVMIIPRDSRIADFSEPVMSCIVLDMILSWPQAISSKAVLSFKTRFWRVSGSNLSDRVSKNLLSGSNLSDRVSKNLPKTPGNRFE